MTETKVTYIYPPSPDVANGITHIVCDVIRKLAEGGHKVTVYASNVLNLPRNFGLIRARKLYINEV